MEALKQNLEAGVPYTGFDSQIDKNELARLVGNVEEAGAIAHENLYASFYAGDGRSTVFSYDDADEPNQYISFVDRYGDACFGPWQPGDMSTDVGIRAANPRFNGVLNPTTVLHADAQTLDEYCERQGPNDLVDALDALVIYNNYIIEEVAKPYLTCVADSFRKAPEEYVEKFFPKNKRSRTLTRAILYHADAPSGMRPTGSDGEPLMIKEHADKCSFTIDSWQSGPGLQYLVDGEWQPARQGVAIFRGSGMDGLNGNSDSLTPPTFHRAVLQENQPKSSRTLQERGIARMALPTFISIVE